MPNLKIVFGGGGLRPERGFPDPDAVREGLDVLEAHGIDTIDTAAVYGPSETLLGQAGAGPRFIIDTKVMMAGPGSSGSLTERKMKASVENSLQLMNIKKINILYFHMPDKSTPIEESLAAVDELHKAGIFQRFGLSNYLAADVERIHEHCLARGYVLPTVYQGNYNPLARRQEAVLLPVLRRLGIAFYAYSPIAGGFLAKSKQQVLDGAGRFKEGSAYWKLYATRFLEVLATWDDIAASAGCAPAELAYRWVRFGSALSAEHGDAIIMGAHGLAQLKENLKWLENGPLDKETCDKIDVFWEQVKDQAPLDNING